MKKSMAVLLGFAALVLVASPLYGQTGCTDSPENPTAVLAMVGGAGALFSAVRARVRRNAECTTVRPARPNWNNRRRHSRKNSGKSGTTCCDGTSKAA